MASDSIWVLRICLGIGLLLVGCTSPSTVLPSVTPTTIPPTPTVHLFYRSEGGGEPRTAGYWMIWNSCAEDNKAEVAAANGGREAGWLILDDLLDDPGVLVGPLAVETCEQAVALLEARDTSGRDRADDVAYALAAQLLTAQLNLAGGAEYCPAVGEAVQAGQLLLISLEFDRSGGYLDAGVEGDDRALAQFLTSELISYNVGDLCR